MGLEKFKSDYYIKYPNSSLKIIKEDEKTKNYIIVGTEFGDCKVRKQHIMNGHVPTIQSAINKKSYFINKVSTIHNYKYNYDLVNYKNNSNKITIICKTHGKFEQTPQAHIAGQGCPKCGDNVCSDYHSSNPTGWSKTNWKKAASSSKKFESFKVYIIKCYNNVETFYKIGRTFVNINQRFQSKTEMPYIYSIVKIIEGDCEEIYELETKLKNMNKENKYIPLLKFNGSKECFNNVILIW